MIVVLVLAILLALVGLILVVKPAALRKVNRPIMSPFMNNYEAPQPSALGFVMGRLFGLGLLALSIFVVIKTL
ncbi:DUF6199 family natural product biosynthesis protein [Streptomyces sp. 049-1]|uniref:DUF6199 family natural product biosynthesis protein n=1 Tax=Streptomyces sp. 049-1 TaxID=2789264 RepID=UPI00397F7C1F